MLEIEWTLEQIDDKEVSVLIILKEVKEYTIGRKKDYDIISQNRLVSRNHALLSLNSNGRLFVKDLKSANGTYINNAQIPPLIYQELVKNDILGIGAPSTAIEKKKEIYRVSCNIISANQNENVVLPVLEDDLILANVNKSNTLEKDVTCNVLNSNKAESNETIKGDNKKEIKVHNGLNSENNEHCNEIDKNKVPSVTSWSSEKESGRVSETVPNINISSSSTLGISQKEHNEPEPKKLASDSITKETSKYLRCKSKEELMISFTQDDNDDIVILSDDEDIFPKSQIFGDVVVKTEPTENEFLPVTKCVSPPSDNDNFNDNIFSEIVKNEVQDYDYNENEDDDEDCIIWFNKLSQSQEIASSQESKEQNIPRFIDETDNDDFLKFDDCDLEIFDNIEKSNDIEVPDKVNKKSSDIQLSDQIPNKSIDENAIENRVVQAVVSDISDNDEYFRTEEVVELRKDEALDKKKAELKKFYVKPPVIDAPVLQTFRKRKALIETSLKEKRRKSIFDETNQVNKSVREELDKRHKKRRLSTEYFTKNEKQKIQEDRKRKLKEIASKNIEYKDNKKDEKNNKKEEVTKSHTKPKVKVSNSRGLFLTDLELKKESKRKKKSDNCHEDISVSKNNYKIPKKTDKALNEPSCSYHTTVNNVNKTAIGKKTEIVNTEKPVVIDKTIGKEKDINPEKTKHKDDNSSTKFNVISKNSKKKRVTFKDEPEIKYIECLPGIHRRVNSKDAPMPTFVPTTREENEILSTILEWRPAWLEEQKKINNSPQVSKKNPTRMLSHFYTSRDYVNTVTPLMLLELWKTVFRDWCNSTLSVKLACIVDIQQKPDGLYLNCYCMEDKDDTVHYPWRGDLLVAEFYFADTNIKTAKKFGYVTNISRQRLGKSDIVHKQFSELGLISEFKITFTMIIKDLQVKILQEKLMRIRLVSRIAPQLRVFKSISFLLTSPLCKFILNPQIKDYKIINPTKMTKAITDELNSDQMMCVFEAYQICTRNEPGIYLIQGPPGTGKSFVIKNIIRQLLFDKNLQNCRILLCAPSNGAVDEITNTLLEMRSTLSKNEKFKMIRLGPPGAVQNPIVKSITVSELVKKHLQQQQYNNIKSNSHMNEEKNFLIQKINTLENKISSLKVRQLDTSLDEQKLQKAKQNLQLLQTNNNIELSFSEKKRMERDSEMYFIQHAQVICTTLSSCAGSKIEESFLGKQLPFTCCIVDEATQCCEQDALIPLTLGITKFVLVGDPEQLPATIISQEAKGLGYGVSLFERIQNRLDYLPDNPIRMLTEQYRMHHEICNFPSNQFYGGRLKTAEILKKREGNILYPCRLFCLTNGINNKESEYLNKTEANLVVLLTEIVLKKTNYNIGIITPYTKQKHYLINRLSNIRLKEMSKSDDDKHNLRVTINTVDGFQGQERDVIIISSVRHKNNIFLNDRQRLNVALTRAKEALFICAHSNLFQNKSVWQELEISAKNRSFFYSLNDKDATDEKYMTDLIIKH